MFSKIWNWLDGKKTVIASLAGVGLAWAQAKGLITGDTALYLAAALSAVTGVAVGHKVVKAAQE